MSFEHQRHKPPTELKQPRPLVLACPPLRSNVNLCRIIRTAGCCGIRQLVLAGAGKLDSKITRGAELEMEIRHVRTLTSPLKKYKQDGLPLVGLEQATESTTLAEFAFPRASVLVLGHERLGIPDDILGLLDHVVEIPVYGSPFSFNVATATAMALYEYCRQYPRG